MERGGRGCVGVCLLVCVCVCWFGVTCLGRVGVVLYSDDAVFFFLRLFVIFFFIVSSLTSMLTD